jgi:hypothetical protein
VSRALAIDPARRFQTGSEFFDAFDAALRGELWAKADISGVRPTTESSAPRESVEPKNVLRTALGAATSLLKRFTGARERAVAKAKAQAALRPPPLPRVLVSESDEAVPSSRRSIWLDSTELEDHVPTDLPPSGGPSSYAPVTDSELILPSAGAKKRDKPKGKGKRKRKAKARAEAQAEGGSKHAAVKKPNRKRKRKA